MTKITAKAVLEAMRELVKEFGVDYVYPAIEDEECTYARDGAPSCIVGHIAARLDPELFQRMAAEEDEHGAFSVGSHDNYLHGAFGEATQLLRHAQIVQDVGDTWGDVLRDAEASYSIIRGNVIK